MPPVQVIRSYVDIQPLIQLTQFNRVSSEQIVKAYQLTDRLKDTIVKILTTLAGERGPQLIAGQRGAGKTHLLTIIRALMMRPALASLLRNIDITAAANRMLREKFYVIELHLSSDEPPDLFTLLREELAARDEHPITFSDSEWEASMMGEGVFRLIKSKLPEDTIIVLLIDGISGIMRSDARMRVQFKRWLLWAADRFKLLNQSIIITMDDDLIDSDLASAFQVLPVDIDNLREIADRFIFRKTELQRSEIANIYTDLCRFMPSFPWPKEHFVALFPIHPAVLEVAPHIRKYSRSFTLFGFISSAAARALNRKAYNLTSLDELFDSFEFDLRKNEALSQAFAAYDQILQTGLSQLTSFDEKLWAKLAVKALFIYSLSGQPVRVEKLADSVLLYDERDPRMASQKMRAIIGCFVSTTPKAIEVTGEGQELACRFKIGPVRTPQQILDEAAARIADDDPQLADMLIRTGGNWFSDWPFSSLQGQDEDRGLEQAELYVEWRGTQRLGLFCIGAKESALQKVEFRETFLTKTADEAQSEEDDLPIIEVLVDSQSDMATIKSPDPPPIQVCEYDWQVCILPLYQNPPQEVPEFLPPSLYYWQPMMPSPEELDSIKRLFAIKTEREVLSAQGVDCHLLEEKLENEVQQIFYNLYVKEGHFLCPATKSAVQVSGESISFEPKLLSLLYEMVCEGLNHRYPEHPTFGAQFTDYELLRLSSGLFGGISPSSETIQKYAEQYVLPLKLVDKSTGEYRLSLDPENLSPPVAEVLSQINAAADKTVSLSMLYVALRREPYGLQLPAQRLILLALTALWKIELVDESGTRLLSASHLSSDITLSIYKKARQATINYPPELLASWAGMLIGSQDSIDLISPQGRRFLHEALIAWLQNWKALSLNERAELIPTEMMTRRLWQMIQNSRKYFDNIASLITSLLEEEISPEACISRIIDIFSGKEALYTKAVQELTLLVNFLDWLPFYDQTRKYIIAAEKTGNDEIDKQRHELLELLLQANLLFEETSRQRYEGLYIRFHSQYSELYLARHDAATKDKDSRQALIEYLNSPEWKEFEALSELSFSNRAFYTTALEIINLIRERVCNFPSSELLQIQPHCVCSFRLGTHVDNRALLDTLKLLVNQGITYHRNILNHYLKLIEPQPELLTLDNGSYCELTPSKIEEINKLLQESGNRLCQLPSLRLGTCSTKQELRAIFEKWLESLPDEETIVSLELVEIPEHHAK
ncbi:MAG: DUF6079 family protein [Acidobacteriota bacterium]|nr:ATP-binding protein [Blastocatellia bacterium]MDW8411724.1 DUF6079 family protein [Acidobacteriota bacterium]